MPVTLQGTQIVFNDSTTQSTAFNSTAVLNATAGASVGAVGTYAQLGRPAAAPGLTNSSFPGDTLAGSALRYASDSVFGPVNTGTAPSGTWRCMGFMQAFQFNPCTGTQTYYTPTVWLRIS